jgi:hypothetical protein
VRDAVTGNQVARLIVCGKVMKRSGEDLPCRVSSGPASVMVSGDSLRVVHMVRDAAIDIR